MLRDETTTEAFSVFVKEHEARLRHALTARFGPEVGKDAAAEALAYAWEHWERVHAMESPVGYLYTVGRDRGRRMKTRRRVVFPTVPVERAPWVEPGLSRAVAGLSPRQRTVVVLLYSYEWTQLEGGRSVGDLEVERAAPRRASDGSPPSQIGSRPMTTDLRAQLRELGSFMDEEQSPLTADDIRPPVRPVVTDSPIAVPLAGSRRWRVAVAAAAVVLVLAGGVALLLRVTDAPVATTPPTVPASLGAWSRIPNDEAVFGGEGSQGMISVTSGGPGFLAVGWDEAEGAAYRAPVWTSVDGRTWSRIPHDPAAFGSEPFAVLWGVTAGGPGLVAVGSAEDHVAAVWTSVDGITWSRVPHNAAVFPGGWIKSVTAGGPGLVAVGTGEDYEAAVWTSPDGITWARVPHDPAIFGSGDNQVSMNSVTAGGPGLVAVGEAPSGDGWVNAAVWTSVDGEIWSRVPHDAAVFGGSGVQAMSSVAAGPLGLVAVGRDAPNQAGAVWTSSDGLTWLRVPHDPVFSREVSQSSAEMSSVTVGGPGFVAVGSSSLGSPDARVWTSVDGITWIRVAPEGAGFGVAEMTGVTAGGSGVVAVGAAGSATDFELDASVWLAAIED